MNHLLFVHCDEVDTFGVAPDAVTSAGADVQVLMTHSATQFIGPLTLEALSPS